MAITMIGLDTAKSVFQVHGVDSAGKGQLKRKLRREELLPFFEKQENCIVVIEACGAGHHWARVLTGLGHDVKLIAPEAARPFVCSRLFFAAAMPDGTVSVSFKRDGSESLCHPQVEGIVQKQIGRRGSPPSHHDGSDPAWRDATNLHRYWSFQTAFLPCFVPKQDDPQMLVARGRRVTICSSMRS